MERERNGWREEGVGGARGLVLFSRVLKSSHLKLMSRVKTPRRDSMPAPQPPYYWATSISCLCVYLFSCFYTRTGIIFIVSQSLFLHLDLGFFFGGMTDFSVTLFLFPVLYLFCLGLVGMLVICSVWLQEDFFFSLAKIIIR